MVVARGGEFPRHALGVVLDANHRDVRRPRRDARGGVFALVRGRAVHLRESRDVRSLRPRERSLLSLVVRLGPVEGFVQSLIVVVRGETVRGSPARSLQRARRASRGVARRLGLFPRRELRAKRLDLPALLDQLLGRRTRAIRRRAKGSIRRRPVRPGAERELLALSLRYAAVQPLEHRQARVRQVRVVSLAGKVRVQRRARRDVGFGYTPRMGVGFGFGSPRLPSGSDERRLGVTYCTRSPVSDTRVTTSPTSAVGVDRPGVADECGANDGGGLGICSTGTHTPRWSGRALVHRGRPPRALLGERRAAAAAARAAA